MTDRIPLTATRDMQLADLLRENGLPAETRDLINIWNAPENAEVVRNPVHTAHLLKAGDVMQVPAPPLAPGTVMSTYTCTGSEASTDAIVETIKASHGEGAEEQLGVEPASFTTDYVLGLAHNQQFRNRRRASPPVALGAGEQLLYPTRTRETRTHDVSPSTPMQDGSTSVATGPGPFEVKVSLQESGQILKILDLVEQPQDMSPKANITPTARWRASTVKFKVKITPRAGEITPTSVEFRVYKPDDDRDLSGVYFTETRTDAPWTTNGEHTWEWDGFTKPAPAAGADDTALVDTRTLRGRLTVEVIVHSTAGLSRYSLHLANRPAKAGFVDVRANLETREVLGFAHLSFNHAGEDGGLWLLTLLAGAILAAATVGAIAIAYAVDDNDEHPLTEEQKTNYYIAMGASAAGIMGLAALMGLIFAAPRLSSDDFSTCKDEVLRGIEKHWRQQLRIAGRVYEFYGGASEGGTDTVRFALMGQLNSAQRACNLSLPFPFCPIVLPYKANDTIDTMETGAHEFGHSILVEAFSTNWSQRHKGSSTLVTQAVIEGPDGFAPPGAPIERDLMIYYDETTRTLESFERTFASEVDVLGWIEVAQVEFVEV